MATFPLLLDAAREGDLEHVRTLLREVNDVNEESGETALIFAARVGSFEIASLLIEYGARINHQTESGYSGLHSAAVNNHPSIVSLLIEKGADINIKTKVGNTALMIAAVWGYVSILSFLLHNGADVSLMNKSRKTALDIARMNDKSDCVVILQNYEHFHRYRKVWLSFSTAVSSYQEEQNQESKQNQSQSQKEVQSPSLNRMMDSSDLVRYVTEFM